MKRFNSQLKKLGFQAAILSMLSSSAFAAVPTVIQGPQASGPVNIPPQRENQCRSQAKEMAMQTYQSCLNDARAAQVEQLKKEYQQKLKALKTDYEKQIKSLKSSLQTITPPIATSNAVPATDEKAPTLPTEDSTLQVQKSLLTEAVDAEPITTSTEMAKAAPTDEKPETETNHSEKASSVEGTQFADGSKTEAAPAVEKIQESSLNSNQDSNESPQLINENSTEPKEIIEGAAKIVETPQKSPKEQQELSLQEPKVILKPAEKPAQKRATSKAKTSALNSTLKKSKSSQKIVAINSATKSKTQTTVLPRKTKATVTKPASQVNTALEVPKTAVIKTSELEKSEITSTPLVQGN